MKLSCILWLIYHILNMTNNEIICKTSGFSYLFHLLAIIFFTISSRFSCLSRRLHANYNKLETPYWSTKYTEITIINLEEKKLVWLKKDEFLEIPPCHDELLSTWFPAKVTYPVLIRWLLPDSWRGK